VQDRVLPVQDVAADRPRSGAATFQEEVIVATENRDRSHSQLNESDRNMDSAQARGGQRPTGSSRNESVDAPAELSERGGIRPERTDPAEHTDRSRDRDLS
jgi:hypothetical protein